VSLAGGVDSVCVHGDRPGAVAAARAVRRGLEEAGYVLAAPW
jgi:5-oxoprolinase (ATP-hydrolysing) subunit A